VGERTIAQDVATENWRYLKSQVRYWCSWKYTPGNHPPAYAAWVARMRNAWVAYHAGAPWMTGASWGLAEATLMDSHRVRRDNAQLAAEVERGVKVRAS